ncbi:MAG: septum formation initiator family protein [Caldilineales bacterium]|nr:septum formation initiator family protein [Caldilineales bacterium]MDW8316293.1 septum formation initiator family protein [Anaerolineae bacterium]
MINRPALRNTSASSGLAWPRVRVPGRAIWSRSWLPALAVVALVGLFTVALYLYLVPSSQISETKARIAVLQAERAALARQNARLAQEISAYTELSYIKQRARELGMGPPPAYMYLYVQGPAVAAPAAELPSHPSEPGPSEAPPPSSWWLTARDRALQLLHRLRPH